MDNNLLLTMSSNLSIEPEVLIFLITLPLVITIISFAKYVMGIKSFGVYVPLILTYMFYQFSQLGDGGTDIVQGLKYGLFITIIVFLSSYLSYKLTQKMALHYYSKLAIVTTCVTIVLILVLILLDLLGKDGILKIDIFALILVASISERFTNIHASNQSKLAFMISLQTVILGMLCYLIISLESVQSLLLNHPWVILLAFPINYIIGRFSGLRLNEIYRFRELLDKDTEHESN